MIDNFLYFKVIVFFFLILSINYTNIRVSSRRISISKFLVCCISDSTLIHIFRVRWKRSSVSLFHLFYQFHISTIFEGFLLDDHRLSLHSLLTKKSWIIFSRSTIKKERGEGGEGKEERRIDKWSENSLGSFYLETRFVIISTSFSSRLVAQFDASISAGKKSWEDLSSLQYFKYRCPVSRSWKEGAKKWRTSGTIDFSLLNFVFVETLVKVETSFSKLIYLPSSCRLFLNDFEKLC